MKIKKCFQALLIVVMLFSLIVTGCSPGETPEGQQDTQEEQAGVPRDDIKNPDTFIQATLSGAETLDLHFMSSAATSGISLNVYDSLLASKKGEDLEPSLSTIVPSTENNLINVLNDGKTTIEFPIREGVKFHNGEILTPEDVKYTFMRGIIVGSLSNLTIALLGEGSYKDLVEKVGSNEAFNKLDSSISISDHSIIFLLDEPYGPFLDLMADNGAHFGILNKSWCIEHGAWSGTKETVADFISITLEENSLHDKMMGTGPFEFKTWEIGERVILERFEDYWQGPAKINRAIRQVVSDTNTAILLLQKGDIDFINLDLPDLQQVEGYEGIKVIKEMPTSQLIKINFNFDIHGSKYVGSGELGPNGIPRDFFSDIDVRKAFSYTFDYDTFIDEVLLGAGIKPYGPVLVGHPTANPDNLQYDFDLEKAEKHFKEAFNGELWDKGFKLTVPFNEGNNQRQRALEILQLNLKKINPNFQLEITSLPWPAYVGEINDREMPLSQFGILPRYEHPHFSLAYHMYSRGYYAPVKGYVELAEERYDELVEELGRSFDDERVKEISHELQRRSSEDALSIFHYQVIGNVAMRDWVQGYEESPFPFIINYHSISKE